MHQAIKQAESWTVAQQFTEILESEEQQTEEVILNRWRCQTNASWINDIDKAGVRFVLLDEGPSLFGAQGIPAAASPLHAEAEGLIWAMQELVKAGETAVRFESDCEQLVKLIQHEEDWPALASELDEIKALSTDFSDFSITYIPRSLNVRADCLAKGGRSRVESSPYINALAPPSWLAVSAGQAGI